MFLLTYTLRAFRFVLVWALLLIALAWVVGALWFDFPLERLRHSVAWVFFASVAAGLIFVRPRWKAKLGAFTAIALVAVWWLTLRPAANRDWQPDVAETSSAEINGDEVVLHNVRNFEYRTEADYTPHWETRTVRLSQLLGLDIALAYWGSPLIAHPLVSFRFADGPPLSFSIEARKVVGQEFSTIASLYRQAQLIYVVADERDTIRVRTVYRQGEDVYLYRTLASPAQARTRFLGYVSTLNDLHTQPRWYNVITTNCTTAIRDQHPTDDRMPWDWRILLNGKSDELLYDRHLLATNALSFAELKQRSRINQQARTGDNDPQFSELIRVGVPGFVQERAN
ncbi:MAG: DUF4105 domain-containing protein [Chthoniobacterales bacterium]